MEFFYVLFWKFLFIFIATLSFVEISVLCDYLKDRNDLIKEEQQFAFGGKLNLAGNEVLANECLMHFKRKEIDEAFKNPIKFLPTHNFLEVQSFIARSPIFKIIQMAPKGGVFHTHSTAMASASYIVEHITYEPNLYICLDKKPMRFYFFKTPNKECNWKLLSDVRKNDKSIDDTIFRALVMPTERYGDGNVEWNKFEDIFITIKGLISYRPVFEKHLIRAMDECYSDKVMFMEIRSSLFGIYDLEGTEYDQLTVAKLFETISHDYTTKHPDFLGVKIIYAAYKGLSKENLDKEIRIYKKVKAALPNFIIGFDLIGQEEQLPTLLDRVDQLKALGKEGTSFYFHAGETNWYGLSTDANLYDAVLLNTKRIGHGFALPKHPKLMEMIKRRKIGIELNPISNQILGLVDDLRNHPASIFFAQDMPVIVSNDDPAFWGTEGLSYDFYEAFVGMMSRDADLRALKQLALNSIEYSGLTRMEIAKASNIFTRQWKKFVNDLINSKLCVERKCAVFNKTRDKVFY